MTAGAADSAIANSAALTTSTITDIDGTTDTGTTTDADSTTTDAASTVTNGASANANSASIGSEIDTNTLAKNLDMFVTALHKNTKPSDRTDNTAIAYDPKKREYMAYCDSLYGGDYIVTEEKLFFFLMYQSFRPKKKRGKKRKTVDNGDDEDDDSDIHIFNRSEYDRVISECNSRIPMIALGGIEQYYQENENTSNLIGYSQVNTYLCTIVKLHKMQVTEGINVSNIEYIKSVRVKGLITHVKERKKLLKKIGREEKVKNNFAPFHAYNSIPVLEQWFWDYNNTNVVSGSLAKAMAALRDRFVFLDTLQAVLRGESLYNAELSDFSWFVFGSNKEPHPMNFLINDINFGKTAKDKEIFGRRMRHLLAERCAVGAFFLYLLCRFAVTKEFDNVDFTNNEWFDIKLLVNHQVKDNTVKMGDQSYSNKMKKACQHFQIPTSHFLHFGRAVGAAGMDLENVPMDQRKQLGYWSQDVYEKVYSVKMPMTALRSQAGFQIYEGCHYNPRTMFDGSKYESLSKKIFPFVDAALEQVEEEIGNNGTYKHQTAVAFLNLLKYGRTVLMQDVAWMMSKGRTHPILIHHQDIFYSQEFQRYQKELVDYVTEEQKNDPLDASIEKVLPGVKLQLTNIHQELHGSHQLLSNKIEDGFEVLAQRMDGLEASTINQDYITGFLQHIGNYDAGSPTSPASPRPSAGSCTYSTQEAPGEAAAASSDSVLGTTTYSFPDTSVYRDNLSRVYDEWQAASAAMSNKLFKSKMKGAENKHAERLRYIFNYIEKNKNETEDVQETINRIQAEIKEGKSGPLSLTGACNYLKKKGKGMNGSSSSGNIGSSNNLFTIVK